MIAENVRFMSERTCTRCDRTLPLTEFGKHRGTKDGINLWCKECNREKSNAYYQTPSGIYSQIGSRERYFKRKPVVINRQDFVEWYNAQEKKCAYCDIPEEDFLLLKERYGSRTNRLTVDCKDNEVGYVVGNMVLACERCNFIKSNLLSFEEMRDVAQRYIKPKWKALKEGRLSRSIYLKDTKR